MDYSNSVSSPALDGFAIVPHADQPLPQVTKAIFVGGAGDVRLRLAGSSSDLTFRSVAAGSILDLRTSHVRDSGTTATDLIGLL